MSLPINIFSSNSCCPVVQKRSFKPVSKFHKKMISKQLLNQESDVAAAELQNNQTLVATSNPAQSKKKCIKLSNVKNCKNVECASNQEKISPIFIAR